MKALNIISWSFFILGLLFKFIFEIPGHSILLLIGCPLILVYGFIVFFKNLKSNLTLSFQSISFSFLSVYLFFYVYHWDYSFIVFSFALLLSLTSIVLSYFKKTKLDNVKIILLLFSITTSILFIYRESKKGGFDDMTYRNENWSWFVDKETGIGSWHPIGGKMELETGDYTRFYSTGEIRETGRIKDFLFIDTGRIFDKLGNCIRYTIISENSENINYYVNNGKYEEYYNTGELFYDGYVVNHKLEGLRREYDKNGRLTYQDNIINNAGWSSYFYESGVMKDSFYLSNGKQQGISKQWYKNGNIEEIASTKDNKREGWQYYYYETGVLKQKVFYVLDKKHGILYEYYPSGILHYVVGYKNDEKHGEFKEFYENKKLRCSGSHEYGRQVGEWLWYEKTGKLFQKDLYENGELIKVLKL